MNEQDSDQSNKDNFITPYYSDSNYNTVDDEESNFNTTSSSFESNKTDFNDIINPENYPLYHSTSLNRQIDGINQFALQSSKLSSFSDELSYKINKESLLTKAVSYEDNVDYNTTTPNNRLSDSSDYENKSYSNNLEVTKLSSNHVCATPVTKKTSASLLDQSSLSSLRFNSASLISLPYGYNNNTFTKIKSYDINYPNQFRKRIKYGDVKNEIKNVRNHFQTNDYSSDYDMTCDSPYPSPINSKYINNVKNGVKKSLYNLMVHNEYSSNPYKRRYQSVVNERRRLFPINETLSDVFEHISLPERLYKRQRRGKVKREEIESEPKETSTTDEDSTEESQLIKQDNELQCYTLPQLHVEYMNYLNELTNSNLNIETNMLNELKNILNYVITTRQRMYDSFYNQRQLPDFDHDKLNIDNLKKIKLSIQNILTTLNNDLISLNYSKGLLKTDYASANSNESYNQHIDFSYGVKRLKRLFKNDLYNVLKYSSDEYSEDSSPTNDSYVLCTSPALTFYNGFKCIHGQCSTSNYLNDIGVITECDSSSGCYVWNEKNQYLDPFRIAKIGTWTSNSALPYELIQQNKRRQLDSTISFIKDVCKVAIAEIRIPKPEWSEFTEYTCLNGYCCKKCCTCLKSTDQNLMYTSHVQHKPLEDKNINFSVETKLATVDLLKNVLGSCSCYCKCSSDASHVMDRAINEVNTHDCLCNESISWYEVETNNLNFDPVENKYTNENIVQERFILRIKLDSLPLSMKTKVPFTCKLDINYKKEKENHNVNDNENDNDNEYDEVSCKKRKLSSEDEVHGNSTKLSDFKFINDFTFWDAIEIIKNEQNELHHNLKNNEKLLKSNMCFDAMEIDTSHVQTETIELNAESFSFDGKRDSYVEIALYLPYVPSTILPWEFECLNPMEILNLQQSDEHSIKNEYQKERISREYNVVPRSLKNVFNFMRSWILRRNYLIANERDLYEQFKVYWNEKIKKFDKNKIDIFSWGVLPVRAIDLPDVFIPLPAGYNRNDISYPYTNQGTTSPFNVKGYGIGDINFKKIKFSQLDHKTEEEVNESMNIGSRQRSTQGTRRKQTEELNVNKPAEADIGIRSSAYLVQFFSNLTGPSVRWTHSLMDSMKEPLEYIPDFKSLPIYKSMKCPELSFYKLDNLIIYDRKNKLSNQQHDEDELNYRVSQVWTKAEVKIFTEKYLMHPKNFSKIAQFLENKKVSDCIDFYYRFKYRLKLKSKLHELRVRNKGKFDMTKNLRREACILDSLENMLEDCNTDFVKDFNARNKLPFNSVSDYMLRSGCVDSGNEYDIQYTQHFDPTKELEQEYQYTLDNIAEGYFLPKKYLSMTTRKYVQFPAYDASDDQSSETRKGCFVFDYNFRNDRNDGKDEKEEFDIETDIAKSMIVSINSESFFNNRYRGQKKVTLSNVDKILYQFDDQNQLIQEPLSPDLLELNSKYNENIMQINGMKDDHQLHDMELRSKASDNTPRYQGMVTRKKVLNSYKYAYDSPRTFRYTHKSKMKRKQGKWTSEEKQKYNETFRTYGKDWSKLYHAMAPYGKSMDQVKNFYHKNNFKRRF
ncbi:hypothetical protein TpMuguga_04g00507 [Theileria parva strain Muguga]|uniref:SANT domain-containing protein n=1 Tax=Theileria parva TaxID=5875 RepID=Q4N259_THEPA|nr:uncharacterized protein TpMuguga_04g00507 [Theileria parva strain Muguga]EAN31859.1 hypothetical protein TpMuguga_04g00507 [Theileria parva strain Muguga]|eukprot:XP_764142.1 hypothetical protein [Theileria parva strain Muguga]